MAPPKQSAKRKKPLTKAQREIQAHIASYIEDNDLSYRQLALMVGGNCTNALTRWWALGEATPGEFYQGRLQRLGVLPDADGNFADPESALSSSADERDDLLGDLERIIEIAKSLHKRIKTL